MHEKKRHQSYIYAAGEQFCLFSICTVEASDIMRVYCHGVGETFFGILRTEAEFRENLKRREFFQKEQGNIHVCATYLPRNLKSVCDLVLKANDLNV